MAEKATVSDAGGFGDAARACIGLRVEDGGGADDGGELGGKGGDFEYGGIGFGEETLARGPDVGVGGSEGAVVRERAELLLLIAKGVGLGGELDVECEVGVFVAKLHGFETQGSGGDAMHEVGELRDGGRARGETECAGGKWMQAEGDLCDDAECAEGSGEEFGEIVTGDVLDDLAAAARDGAVGEDDGHADDEIAKRAIAAAESSAVVGGDDAADGGAIREDGIECDALIVAREFALHGGPWRAGGDGGGHVLPDVFADAGEACG